MPDEKSRSRRLPGLRREIALDLGTTNTRIYVEGAGVVLDEPSVVALDLDGEVISVGREAWEMLGRTPSNIRAIKPLSRGVIADFNLVQRMITHFLSKARARTFSRPRAVVNVPFGTTQVERRAVIEAVQQAGARDVFLIEAPLAAAIGAGLPVTEAVGSMIIDLGGGTMEVAVISLSGVVRGVSLTASGESLDLTLQEYLRRQLRFQIGERSAENLKKEHAYACDPPEKSEVIPLYGINLETGLPGTLNFDTREISKVIRPSLDSMVQDINGLLERIPPQLAADLISRGAVLTGGGAALKNLDLFISRRLGLPATVAENHEHCVVIGAGQTLAEVRHWRQPHLHRA